MNKVVYIILVFGMMCLQASAQQAGHVYTAAEVMDGEGAEVLRLFPSKSFKHSDPFILLDDFSVQPPAGFPAHEHKGFEAITYMMEGGFVHKDNLGHVDTIFAGGVQYFFAGRGLVHSEMPGTSAMNKGLQLWLNIPASNKNNAPLYRNIDSVPVTSYKDNAVIIRTVVGGDSSMTVNCGCDLSYLDISLKKDSVSLSPSAGYTTFIYVTAGELTIHNNKLVKGQFYFLESGMQQSIASTAESRFVYLSAKPLNQSIKQRGPYVY